MVPVWAIALVAVLLALACTLLIVLLARRIPDPEPGLRLLAQQMALQANHSREIGRDLADQARDGRQELVGAVRDVSRSVAHQIGQFAGVQDSRFDGVAQRLDGWALQSERRLEDMRQALDTQLERLRADSQARLESIRETVDERLRTTLEQRLGESFRLVSERLEQLQRGLGEMQALATDVGDLKRLLGNVKTRGVWGEAQLATLLEQLFSTGQYDCNVEVVAGSGERVEFALRLPGAPGFPVWLPIDAKFPREDYERLLAACERADGAAAEQSSRRLETRLRAEARSIRAKYVAPPATTDFALLFLPVEGLFAEVARRPGLLDALLREERVIIAGPTTLAAILSSLQMGLRTVAIDRRSAEIRQLLAAVRLEFSRFGDTLARTRDQLEKAAGSIGHAESRSRAISRHLDEIETLPLERRDG